MCVTGSLMYLNEATLLNNVRVRYSKDKIYVSIFFIANVVMKTLFFMYLARHNVHSTWHDVLSLKYTSLALLAAFRFVLRNVHVKSFSSTGVHTH